MESLIIVNHRYDGKLLLNVAKCKYRRRTCVEAYAPQHVFCGYVCLWRLN